MLLDLWPLVHNEPIPGPALLGPVFQQDRPQRVMRDRGRLAYRITAHATARTRGKTSLRYRAHGRVTPHPARASGSLAVAVTPAVQPLPLRAERMSSHVATGTLVRCADHTHLRLPLPLLDLLFDPWED